MDQLREHLQTLFAVLQSERYLSVIYVDDCYLQGDSFTEWAQNVIWTIEIPESLGFFIKIDNPKKNEKQQNNFFGFIIDSLDMAIELIIEKKQKIQKLYIETKLVTLLLRNWLNSLEIW